MEASTIRRSLLAVAVGLAMGTVGVANATNGYFKQGFGTKTKGMGGVGMAISQDSYAPGTNPAGIAGMETRIDASLAWFRPERFYEAGQLQSPPGPRDRPLRPGKVDSDSENFFIPSLGFVHQIDETRSWGIALLANGGLNTDYPNVSNGPGQPPGTFGGGAAGVNLEQLAIIPTYAQTFADGRISVGVSPIVTYSSFEADGLESFRPFSTDPDNLTDNGEDSDFGFGGQIGFQAQLNEQVRIGASYRSRISGTTFDDYAGLFAEGGDLDAPETWGLGVAFEVTPQLTIAADYQRINYSDVDSVGNSFDNLFVAQQTGDPNFLLGGENGPGFGWDDIDIFKLGLQYEASNEWTWRVGYNHGDNPIDSDEVLFNILAPGVMEDHLTAGFTKRFGERHELNFAAMYAPEESVSGPNPFADQELEIEMQQFELEVGYAYRF